MSKPELPPELVVDSRWDYGGRTYRVMAIAEGYVMYRMKGCSAGCSYWKDFLRRFAYKPLGKTDHRESK